MHTTSWDLWDQTIIDADPPVADVSGLGSQAVGDIDGDGRVEILTAGEGALLWYRPATLERGVVAEGRFHVGLSIGDVDGDGRLEVLAGKQPSDAGDDSFAVTWYKPDPADLHKPWQAFAIDPDAPGGSHDVILADVDGDGVDEVVASSYGGSEPPGVFLYKHQGNPREPWARHDVQRGRKEEGLVTGDLTSDGRVSIVSGPCIYLPPEDGPFSGPWKRVVFAPSHREMNRVALVDISGSGRPDIVIVDSEYFEGQLSWVENRMLEDADRPWVEHPIERGLVYAHSLHVRMEDNTPRIFVAEMAGGGWKAPYNFDARHIEYTTRDAGKTWNRVILEQGQGTHEAVLADIDSDGQLEIVGKEWRIPRVHIWKKPSTPSPLRAYRHEFIDRDKPGLATDILAADVNGDGLEDIVCGRWWYRQGDWQRFEIPGIGQVHCAWDLDGDGQSELIATKRKEGTTGGYESLTSTLVWLDPIDPEAGEWAEYPIGEGVGDWPHGSCIDRLGPGGRPALVTAYHSAHSSEDGGEHYPDLFEVPEDPRQGPWPRRTLAPVPYGEEILARDITGNGTLDLIAGPYWLENLGDGTYKPYRYVADEEFYPARLAVANITGAGRCDIVLGQEKMDFPNRTIPFSPVAWFACPEDPRTVPWPMHVIDRVRCAHSIGAADLDGDGVEEIVVGEHDPFYPYRNRCRLFVYAKADPEGRSWRRYQLDDRFEHHDGTKIIRLEGGQMGIISHGWKDSLYVHLYRRRP